MNLEKVVKLLNLTTSDSDGEALNAIRAANAFLAKTRVTWNDVIESKRARRTESSVGEMLSRLRACKLRNRKRAFLSSLEKCYRTKGMLTERHERLLREIYKQFFKEEP